MSEPLGGLVCTVGVSIARAPSNRSVEPRTPQAWVAWLKRVEPMDRQAGAEINSLQLLLDGGLLSRDTRVCFVASDTEDGKLCAETLRLYYKQQFRTEPQVVVVEGLQPDDAKAFRQGLTRLVQQVSRLIRDQRRLGLQVGVNATGGFKAALGLLVMLGQVLGASVYYRFEDFDDVVHLPPLPVGFDYGKGSQIHALFGSEPSRVLRVAEVEEFGLDHSLGSLLEFEGELVGLSALGAIFLEGFEQWFGERRDRIMPPDAKPSDKKVSLGDHTSVPGQEEFMKRLVHDLPYVRLANSVRQARRLMHGRFRPDGRPGVVRGWYSDGTHSACIELHTTATTETETAAVSVDVNKHVDGWS